MVLVLPPEDRGQVYTQAPDLWAACTYTAELQAPETTAEVPVAPAPRTSPVLGAPPGQAEREWARLWGQEGARERLDPWDGYAACDAAMERGDLEAAQRIAAQTLGLARSQSAASDAPPGVRNLAIALDKVGGIEEALGKLEAARAAYREGLELARRLLEVLGGWTPPALRDLSVSLDNVGGIEETLGNLEAARGAYRGSLEGFRRLRVAYPKHPQFDRDMAFAEARSRPVRGPRRPTPRLPVESRGRDVPDAAVLGQVQSPKQNRARSFRAHVGWAGAS